MALFPAFDTDLADMSPESALRFPLGAASPLWFAFASAATAGVAYWWMTRWTRPAHIEAVADWFSPKPGDEPAAPMSAAETVTPRIVAQPTIETPVEAALEPVEAATDAVIETMEALTAPMTAQPEDASEIAVEASAAVADDLTRLVGVGPKLAQRLAELGVTTFKDIAAWTEADLAAFDKALELKGRVVRDAWVAQARRFAEA